MRRTVCFLVFSAVIAAGMFGLPKPASAIPLFAHRYGLTCQACHTEVPHLNPFGEAFLADGYRLPGVKVKNPIPLSVRIQTAYSSAASTGPEGSLPKTIVDEIELLTGGSIGSRGSYWAEAYLVDGGRPGRPRDVWAAYRLTPDGSSVPVMVRGGEFTLPLPVDPETFRETNDHYEIWDQTAGNNPFNFFAVKIGSEVEFGDRHRNLGVTVAALQGHDTDSGLPVHGTDTMVTVTRAVGRYLTLTGYRYDGSRSPAGVDDRFWRDGYAVGFHLDHTEVDAVYQTGNDTSADVFGDALQTSGGFLQVRQDLGPRMFGIARWDATQDVAFARSITAGLGYRPARNSRLTVFDTIKKDDTGINHHTVSSALLVAF